MTVKELIEKLRTIEDKNGRVYAKINNKEHNIELPIEYVETYDNFVDLICEEE